MTSVVAAQASGRADHHQVAEQLARIGCRRRHAERDHHAGERQQQAEPLHQAEAVAGQEPARAEHHEERREIDEQHRAGRGGVEQPAVDQQEFEAEQRAGDEARRRACRRAP